MTRPKAMYELDDPSVVSMRTKNVCIYAYPGGGKTVLWGSGGERVLIMDSDDGIDSALAFGSKAKAVPVQDYDELSTMMEWLRHDQPKEMPDLEWVVWDSLTLFQDRALIDEILVDAHAENPRQSEDVASQREYLINMNRIGKYVRMLVALPINVGISCHVTVEPDPEGELVYMPAVQGKNMPSKVAGYCNVVGYLGQTTSGKRRLITERTGNYFAKDRFHALRTPVTKDGTTSLKGFVDNPTLPKLEELFAKKNGRGTAAPARPRRRKSATTTTK